MSCSTTPHVIIDDDDEEFDWEAAVKEIDVACEKGAVSTSYSTPRKPSAPRQSTLDRFVQNRHHTVNNNQNRHQTANNHDDIIGDGVAGCYCKIDMEAAKTWIYPVNIPLRDYQLSITKTALFSNTLVALPTGLGKTFIAAVVMYNYFRWFPEGKIVFTAPSRPLVMQQIEACHNIVGIPQEWTIDLTGQTSPDKRENLWKNKRVFFATPQVFEKDIQSGTCSLKYLVCLVIDEAHRALGNYSYCVAVRELMAAALHFRILALTATPGSKQQTIQKVIDNLQISHLEYRKEGDHDVSPYVHDRKLELITVAMGKDAVEISDMLLESIRPLVNKLSSYGVLFNRDFQTLSPLDLLNARERFRTAPPVDLSHVNCDDADGILGVLITLYHVRKLLSSHGIKPAYEMLESKLKQGYILKYMSRNEAIRKTKLLMEQNLSHGAPNPKLVKMTEILIDHFRTNDPKNSRVIIFSNFRGSVRDIMNSLSSIGESIKATEFIGQSSGKNLKGQTQKIQQAVLQKFRAGGYNIIVATSIGEEGLDIMEVDLVICFDANISPLRMIQRMGRTGRKHDGRVVVLACEGSELKGYMRKQANSKAVNKHMRNGGINSFVFHSSPRMIPHICKPEVRFHEFKIEQFVPRGKKTKDGCVNVSTLKDKLSDAEAELIAKYYPSSGRYTWKPSLNAFPHFQTFPSKVYKIKHSFRTRILIGTMQHLQALSFSTDTEVLPAEIQNKTSSDECMGGTSLQNDTSREDFICFHDSSGDQLGRNISAMEEVISRSPEEHQIPDPPIQNTPVHCYLFGDTYVSVNTFGAVSIALVPSLPFLNKDALSKSKEEKSRELMNTVECNPSLSRAYSGHTCKLSLLSEANIANPAKPNCSQNCLMSSSPLLDFSKFSEPLLHTENVVLTPSPKRNCRNSEAVVVEEFTSTRRDSIEFTDLDTFDVRDMEMSPRLTNMIEKGVVPESPLAVSEIGDHPLNGHTVCKGSSSEHLNSGLVPSSSREVQVNEISKEILQSAVSPYFELRKQLPSPSYASIALGTDLPLKELSSEKTGNAVDCNAGGLLGYTSHSPINKVIHTPVVEMTRCGNVRVDVSGSPIIVGVRTPLNNLTNSCSNDWRLSSAESSKSIKQAPKFRRLRKLGESKERISTSTLKDNSTGPISNLIESTTRQNRVKGKRKIMTQAKLFIEEEAEVSSDAAVSDDEEEDNGSNSNEDSFIDDRINPTMESTQAECDMMAIYRRSLLSQFSMESPPCCSTDLNTSSTQCRTEGNETERSSSGKNSHSLQTPQTVLRSVNQSPGKNSHSLQTPQTGLRSVNQLAERGSSICQIESNCIPSMYMLNEARTDTREERQMESRKRKLSFHQVGYDPVTSLQPQRLFHSEATGETPMHCQPENNGLTGDIFSDDQFYEGLDLDELEAQATELLRHTSELSIDRKHMNISDPLTKINPEISHSPSFDLGI